VQVKIESFAYHPGIVHARVRQTLVWTNDDAAPHNVTYAGGTRFTSSPPVMRTGARFQLKLTQAGTIEYYCTIHPWMKGTIAVSP
jgi:plastocyanin